MEEKRARKYLFAVATGILIGFMYVAGQRLDAYDTLDLLDRTFYAQWLAGSLIAALVVYAIWGGAQVIQEGILKQSGKICSKGEGRECLRPLLLKMFYLGAMLLGWLPAFLSILPGVFSYDAYAEWEQVKTGMLTSHHPVLHVLLAGGLPEISHRLTGSYNLGIGIYTVLQMLLAGGGLTLTLFYMKKRGIGSGARLLALGFYSFSPVLQLFAICVTKDVLFSICELLFMISVLTLMEERIDFFAHKRTQTGFVLTALGTMILRNNGLYIVLIMLVVLFFFCRNYWKKYVLLVALTLLLYGVYVGPLYVLLSVTPGGVEEMLSVPIQQMARVYHYEYDNLDSQDLELLYRVLPRENLEGYKPTVADPVKSGFDRKGFDDNRKEFFALWLRWGMEHPLTYVNSLLVNTVDFWYPGAVIDGYRDPYGRSSYFDYRVAEPGEEIVLLQRTHNYYERISLDKTAQQKPLAFLALSPGWYFLMFLVVFMYLWCHKKRRLLVPLLIPLLTMATVLPGPMALVRYVLIFFYAFPLILAIFLCPQAFEGTQSQNQC